MRDSKCGTPGRSNTCAVIRGNGETGFCPGVVAQVVSALAFQSLILSLIPGRKPVFLIPSYLLSACVSPSISTYVVHPFRMWAMKGAPRVWTQHLASCEREKNLLAVWHANMLVGCWGLVNTIPQDSSVIHLNSVCSFYVKQGLSLILFPDLW